MPLDVDALLSGPRGRRLCLEAAIGDVNEAPTAQELRTLVVRATHDLHGDTGQSARYVASSSRWSLRWGSPPPEPEWTPELIGERLSEARLRLDATGLLEVLRATVDRAVYWQPPDGEDVLTTLPELAEPLAAVADQLLASPATNWWSNPCEPSSQRVTVFTPGREPVPRSVKDSLREWREHTLAGERRAERERPSDPTASYSGEWWSAPVFAADSSTRDLGDLGAAGLYLVEDGMGWETARVLPLEVQPRSVYEIDGPEAWAALCRRFPLEVTASRRHDWYRVTGLDTRWVIPDWSAVAAHHDGVHLTVSGYLTTAGRGVTVDETHSTVLAGWHPGETYWFRDVEPDRARAEKWLRDDQRERWVRLREL